MGCQLCVRLPGAVEMEPHGAGATQIHGGGIQKARSSDAVEFGEDPGLAWPLVFMAVGDGFLTRLGRWPWTHGLMKAVGHAQLRTMRCWRTGRGPDPILITVCMSGTWSGLLVDVFFFLNFWCCDLLSAPGKSCAPKKVAQKAECCHYWARKEWGALSCWWEQLGIQSNSGFAPL